MLDVRIELERVQLGGRTGERGKTGRGLTCHFSRTVQTMDTG